MEEVGFDVDDVIGDFWDTAIPAFNKKYRRNASRQDFVTFTSVLSIYDITLLEFERTVVEEGILEMIEPYPGTPEVVQKFKSAGSNITFITSRGFHPDAYNVTANFFRHWDIPFDHLYIKEQGKTKADYLKCRLDLFVDDLPKNLVDLRESGKVNNLALIHQLWNREEKGFSRYRHLREVYQRFLNKSHELSL